MKNRTARMLVAAAAIAVVTAGFGTVASAEGSIRLVNGKIEIDSQLKKLAEMYKDETGVDVTIESMGGGIDI